uniref:C2H2-type domain-containing protein n=1 Tax=Eptatretus burgeri TaxID=7764 RepID=A0A8C4N4B2_EPTBU
MGEPESFTAWLHAQGLSANTAQAVVTELGIQSHGVLQACTGTVTLRAELFSLTKRKFPFAMYAEFHKFVESCLELQIFHPEGPLVDILCSLFEVVSREFFSCSQKLSSLKSPSMSYGGENAHLGINISDVCNHHQEEDGGRSQLGVQNQEEAVDFQDNNPLSSQIPINDVQQGFEDSSTMDSSNTVFPVQGVPNEEEAVDFQDNNPLNHVQEEFEEASTNEYNSGASENPKEAVTSNTLPSSQRSLNQVQVFEDASTTRSNNAVSTESDVIVVVKQEPNIVDGLFSQEALNFVSVTEDLYNLQKESGNDSDSAAETSTDNFCELKPKHTLAMEEGILKKQTHHSASSSRNLKSSSTNMKIQIGGTQYKCSGCNKSFSDLSSVENHMKTEPGKCLLKCSLCSKPVIKFGDLKKHMRIHSEERPYGCSVCGKSFKQVGNVNRHMMIHTGERPYNCPICGKCFAQFPNLKGHMRIHNGERPYSCSICGKRFTQIGNVKRHMMIHTGERPHNCPVCARAFAQSANLNKHMMRAHTAVHYGLPYTIS